MRTARPAAVVLLLRVTVPHVTRRATRPMAAELLHAMELLAVEAALMSLAVPGAAVLQFLSSDVIRVQLLALNAVANQRSGIHCQLNDLLKWLVHSLRYLLCLVVNWILHHFLGRQRYKHVDKLFGGAMRYTSAEKSLSHERPAQRQVQLTRAQSDVLPVPSAKSDGPAAPSPDRCLEHARLPRPSLA